MSKSLFALLFAPFFFVACSTNNVTTDSSLQRYFDSAGVKGSFGLFDNGQGHFTIYNLPRYKDSAYQPAGTFDIVQSLVALQTGMLADTSARIPGSLWTMMSIGDTNKLSAPILTLQGAFQNVGNAGNIGFRGISGLLGKDSLKKWLDTVHYGNRDMGGSLDSFWLNNHLKITSDEQLGLIKRLYFDQLPFFNRPQKLVREMMPMESNSVYRMAYKTGRGIKEDGHAIGWVLGWVEENKHPYFFVLNLEAEDTTKDLSVIGLHIVKSILKPMGFFDGKK
ncbi:MAG TPA: penicillin-binding transpeptidase domain-containing protein [Puia sp.]|nr:penicillin-binding transpeptidase domain-containing protein [Puia sp.]